MKNQMRCIFFLLLFWGIFLLLFLVLLQGVSSNAWSFSSSLKSSNVTALPGCTFLLHFFRLDFAERPIPQCSLRSDTQLSFKILIESSLSVSLDLPGSCFKTSIFTVTIPHPLKQATKYSLLSWTNAWLVILEWLLLELFLLDEFLFATHLVTYTMMFLMA